jgi:hypothetical protein
MLIQDKDYVFYEDSGVMNSKQPMKISNATVVGTKNYVFFIPTKTIGLFLVLDTIKNHSYFQGISIPEGVKQLIANSNSVNDLEESLKALLQEDEKYVHFIPEWPSFKFKGFLGKHTLRLGKGGTGAWSSVTVNGKGNSKQFRTYYGQ